MKKIIGLVLVLAACAVSAGEENREPRREPIPIRKLDKLLKHEKVRLSQAREFLYG